MRFIRSTLLKDCEDTLTDLARRNRVTFPATVMLTGMVQPEQAHLQSSWTRTILISGKGESQIQRLGRGWKTHLTIWLRSLKFLARQKPQAMHLIKTYQKNSFNSEQTRPAALDWNYHRPLPVELLYRNNGSKGMIPIARGLKQKLLNTFFVNVRISTYQ